jgi:hypothetical protein
MAVPPVKAVSYYITNINTLGALGAQLGIHDRDTIGAQDNLVILDYGYPARRYVVPNYEYGAKYVFSPTVFIPGSDIITSAVMFAEDYFSSLTGDPNSRLRLVIGTNNCCVGGGLPLFQGHGTAWAQIVDAINSQITACCGSQVKVVAGNDIEIDFNYPYITTQWVDRYVVASQCVSGYGDAGCLYNFGANPGIDDGACASSSDTTWAKCDMWYVSWGVKKNSTDLYTFARPLPEIYHADGSHAEHWRDLSLYSVNVQRAGQIYFVGALTQYARCQANPSQCIIGSTHIDNTPDKGWMQLWNALFSNLTTRMSYLHWSTDIATQP